MLSYYFHQTDESSCRSRLQVVVPTYVDEFDAVVGDGVEGDGDVLQLVVLVLRTLVVPAGRGEERFTLVPTTQKGFGTILIPSCDNIYGNIPSANCQQMFAYIDSHYFSPNKSQ